MTNKRNCQEKQHCKVIHQSTASKADNITSLRLGSSHLHSRESTSLHEMAYSQFRVPGESLDSFVERRATRLQISHIRITYVTHVASHHITSYYSDMIRSTLIWLNAWSSIHTHESVSICQIAMRYSTVQHSTAQFLDLRCSVHRC